MTLDKIYPIVQNYSRLLSKLYFLINEHNEVSDDLRECIYKIDSDLDDYGQQGCCEWSVIQQDYEELLCAGRDYKQWIDFKAA
jgi:hypothetical protein